MPEVQQSQQSGEMTQRFITFVMMQAQQIALCLGQIPHPQTGKPEPNLEAAKLFIDQLEMIREKTRNNLGIEETNILTHVLADLQLAYVRALKDGVISPEAIEEPADTTASSGPVAAPSEPTAAEEENRKRFSKSYGS
jgi:hypothetical protein